MDPRVGPLADTLRLNTTLVRNCLDGVNDTQARIRPAAGTNSMAFVAAHLANARFYLLKNLGVNEPSPLAKYLDKVKTEDDLAHYPTLAEIAEAWTRSAHALRDRLAAISPADLDAPLETRFPVSDKTVLGVLAFLVQHDSYHLGQLSLLRKIAGLPAMSYR